MVIRIPRRAQNRCNLDTALQTLLSEGKALELFQAVLLCCAVYDRVLQEVFAHGRDIDCCFDGSAATGRVLGVGGVYCCVFEFPRVAALAVQQAGVVVTLLYDPRDISVHPNQV